MHGSALLPPAASGRWPAWAAAGMTSVLALACAAPDRPPPLGGEIGDPRATPEAGAQPALRVGAPQPPMCNLGPEGGVCACVDQPLALDPPNLYFVLDRSGSMAEMNKWVNVQSALANLVVALGPRARTGVAVFPDPAADGCAPGVQVVAPQQGDAPAGTLGPTEFSLIGALSRIPPAGGTPTALTLSSLAPAITSLPGRTYVVLATDGGPNCDSSATCNVDQCTDNIDGVAGCPSGGPPNCCASPGGGGALACLDADPTRQAVQALASAGVPVYVLGVPGSAPYADLLDQLAQLGGTARQEEPQYYAIDSADQGALLSALGGIAAQITGTCSLDLGHAPPDPALVNVFFDEKPVPQAGPDGWTLDGATVTLQGASCNKVLDGEVLDVRVVAGCPTVTY